MKIRIILTDDDGKKYEGELEFGGKSEVKKIEIEKNSYKGTSGGIRLIMDNKFLNAPKSVQEIVSELQREGYYSKSNTVDKLLRVNFTNKTKTLTRVKEDNVWKYVIRK